MPCSKYSFFEPPDTAITVSLSVMQAIWPVVLASVSAYSVANSESSPIGEYFFRIISPSLSVNISSGSPLFYAKCFSYFFWDYYTSQIIYSSYNTCCFHWFSSFIFLEKGTVPIFHFFENRNLEPSPFPISKFYIVSVAIFFKIIQKKHWTKFVQCFFIL